MTCLLYIPLHYQIKLIKNVPSLHMCRRLLVQNGPKKTEPMVGSVYHVVTLIAL